MAEPAATSLAGVSLVKIVTAGAAFLGGLLGLSVAPKRTVALALSMLLSALAFGYFGTPPVVKFLASRFNYQCDIDEIALLAIVIGMGGPTITLIIANAWQWVGVQVPTWLRKGSKKLGIPTEDEGGSNGPTA